MTRALVASALAAAAALAALAALVIPVAASAAEPVVTVSPDLAPTGTLVTVDLDGWTGSTTVLAELCGNGRSPGSSDCDLGASDGANVVDGTAHLELRLAEPPSPCPCVVRVRAADGTGPTVTRPVVLTDLAAQPQPAATAAVPSTTAAERAARPDDPEPSEATAPLRPLGLAAAGLLVALLVVLAVRRRIRRRRARHRAAEGEPGPDGQASPTA